VLATETVGREQLWRADLKAIPAKVEKVFEGGCVAGSPLCSPDGRLRVFISHRTGISDIHVANCDGGHERVLVKAIPGFRNPAADGRPELAGWSPDGKWIAFTVTSTIGNADGRSGLYVVDSIGGSLHWLAKGTYGIYFPVWSPDSRFLYATRQLPDLQPGGLVKISMSDGTMSEIVPGQLTFAHLSGDGRYIYYISGIRNHLCRIPSGGGAERDILGQQALEAFYAVGREAVYLFRQSRVPEAHSVIRFDPETRREKVLGEIPFSPRGAFLSPDERFLYFRQGADSKRRAVVVKGLM
jgi:Tol biopolymer transport system component